MSIPPLQLCSGQGVTTLPTTVACATKTGGSSAATNSATTTTGSPSASASGSDSGSATNTMPFATESSTKTSTVSTNYGPKPTAAIGLGAIGGIVAAVAML